ncbi:MAG: PDZ domain-containing protein [Planctomycetes bacterium]|nr:PDZ domain-containing protein [Planctomycetota bacterium]
MVRYLLVLPALAMLASAVQAEEPSSSEMAAAIAAAAPSLVRVEYALRYDKGEQPQSFGGGGRFMHDLHGLAEAVREERPAEWGGFLVGPTTVVAPDPVIHPRFVESIAVRFGEDVVKARPAACGRDQAAVFLELERPLKGARPLAFDADRKGPYMEVTYSRSDGVWTATASSVATVLSVTETGRKTCPAPHSALVVDKRGGAVALSMGGEWPADDSWKGPPSAWKVVTADDLAAHLADVERRMAAGAMRVTLHFRSPKQETGRRMFRSRDDDRSATEQHAVGVLVNPRRVLVLANLKPNDTARLERIVVHPAKGEPAAAKFDGSLKDYGCFVAALEKPLPGAVAMSGRPILDCRWMLLPAAEVRLHGEDWTVYFNHCRIAGFDVGWRRQVYPQMSGDESRLVLFDEEGAVLALPVVRRERVTTEERYSDGRPLLTPVAYLKAVLDDLASHVDAHNAPLTEEEESRLAWLGAELQPLDKELARANKVSDLTHDGESGAIVSYVYPNSPAAGAGVEAGWILLRLRVEGQPKPLDVRLDRDDRFGGPFPWDELDEVQEQYYERIPTPWPGVENQLTRALTDLGFGTKFKAEFFRDGQTVLKDLEVAPGPPHYESAPRAKSAALGLTVRDLTYEVRRYFQKKDDEPGVVVSKVEPGGKASVAGLKPYEIITHVNDKPVANAGDFEAAAAGQDELRLSVKRMTRGRVVKIKMAPAAGPAPKAPGAAGKAP